MKQNLLASIFAGAAMLLCPPVGAMANDADSDSQLTYYLRMVNVDGTEVIVPFSEKPVITHYNNALVLISDEIDMEYPDGTLEFFDITTERMPDSVSSLQKETSAASGLITDNSIVFTGGTPGAMLTVVSVDGTLIASAHLDKEGRAVIPFAPQKGDIYVINSGKTTFKIIKK